MTELNTISLTTYVSEDSEPSKSMIIRLFECLLVRTSLRNYSKVFRKSYASTPLGEGKLVGRFSATEEDQNKMNQNSHRILYGASTIGTLGFLVEIQKWAKKRLQGILVTPENGSCDQLPPTLNNSNEAIRANSEQVALTKTSSNRIMAMLLPQKLDNLVENCSNLFQHLVRKELSVWR